ncbi:MAG: hypothetical protein ONB16_06580 [candidate division KSB1 bacterium]|nr:hypothetical protein [candidate division KSB1 bacterium]MDZ7339794.1 hypothetical protein [candidate division KSB1 bacterium]
MSAIEFQEVDYSIKKRLLSMARRFEKFFLLSPLLWFSLEQAPVDNLTVLNQLASAVVTSMLSEIEVAPKGAAVIRSASARDSCNWWFEERLIQALNDRGVSEIKVDPQANTFSGLLIEYQLLSLGVKYLPIASKDSVQRQASISVAIRVLTSPSNVLSLQQSFNQQYADTVAIRWLDELENKKLSFTMAEPPIQRSKFKQYVEPLIVMATTGTVVVLFYYLRSR